MIDSINNSELIKYFATINPNQVFVTAYPTKPHNYTWCKYCKQKGKIIRFQFFEVWKLIHANSFFHWRKQTIRTKWIAFEEDSWNVHKHDVISATPPSPPQLRQQNLLSENNREVAA